MTKKELIENIRNTIKLLEEQEENIDTRTLVQLGWNLGWHKGIYYTDILEDYLYDAQAINLAIKILEDILDTTKKKT